MVPAGLEGAATAPQSHGGAGQGPTVLPSSVGSIPAACPPQHPTLLPSLQMFPLPVAGGKGRATSLAGAQFAGAGRPWLVRGALYAELAWVGVEGQALGSGGVEAATRWCPSWPGPLGAAYFVERG